MADINQVAKQFVQYYYGVFDRNRTELLPLYVYSTFTNFQRDNSMLTFEGQQFQGARAVVDKLCNLAFTRVAHTITTIDAQPSNPASGPILVSVTGFLMVDDEAQPMRFAQTFQLIPDGNSYYVFNDIFRLNYG